LFYQYSPNDLAANINGYLVSASSVLEPDPSLNFSTEAQSQRYGVELEASGGRKTKGWYYRGSVTLLNAETFQTNGGYQKDRYAVDFITKLTLGREWPGMDRKERKRSYGLNLALIAHGGERYGVVNDRAEPGINIRNYFAAQDLGSGFVNDLGTYFRPDLRLYKTKTRAKTNTTLALDIQNVAGIENVGNVYYDAFLEAPTERLQLGLIPVLSYRVVWR
jgi:hypothetical protein